MKAFGARVAPLMSEDVVEICGAQRGRRWRRGFALDLPQPDMGADDAGQGVLRSAMARAVSPSSAARSTISSGCEAPVRKVKLVVTASSA